MNDTHRIRKKCLYAWLLDATRDIEAALKTLNASVSKDGVIANTIGEPTLHVFNEDLLCLPVKQFIAECVQNFIIGIPSQALTNLCINYVGLLASNVARDVKDGRKSVNTMEELCKKVIGAGAAWMMRAAIFSNVQITGTLSNWKALRKSKKVIPRSWDFHFFVDIGWGRVSPR